MSRLTPPPLAGTRKTRSEVGALATQSLLPPNSVNKRKTSSLYQEAPLTLIFFALAGIINSGLDLPLNLSSY